MSTDVSRRTVLKAGALAGGAVVLGWALPGDPMPSFLNAGPGVVDIPVILPQLGEEVVVQIGDMVAVSGYLRGGPAIDLLREMAHERLERSLAEWPRGWEMIAPENDIRFFEIGPGAQHDDPLATELMIGARQTWRARRIA